MQIAPAMESRHGAPALASSDAAVIRPVFSPTIDLLPAIPRTNRHLNSSHGMRRAQIFAWTGIYVLHAVSAVYFIAAGLLYRTLPSTSLMGILRMYYLTIDRDYYAMIGTVHFIVAGIHGVSLASAFTTVAARYLVPSRLLRRVMSVQRRGMQRFQHHRAGTTTQPRRRAIRYSQWIDHRLSVLYNALFARRGLFGVEGDHFESFFLVRELVETTLQTYQAYQMSRLQPRAWLNRAYFATLVVNCWSTPLIHYFVPRSVTQQRLLCLLSDIVLDFTSSVVVPVVLALEYVGAYNPVLTDFPLDVWYDSAFLIRLMNDTPLILFGSWIDALSRLLFSLSMLASISDVKELIQLWERRRVVPTKALSARLGSGTAVRRIRTIRFAHRVVFCYGVFVLAMQIHAGTRGSPPSCVLQVRPWLVHEPACALVEINCYESRELVGSKADIEAILNAIDPLSVELVVFRHCAQVEITSRLGEFHNLIGLKLYNSTIVEWGTDAALTQTAHPKVRFVFCLFTNFPNASLPAGLLSLDFPQTLTDIEIAGTNLNWLPDDLDLRWPRWLTLFIEFGQFTSFPIVLQKVSPVMLSLIGNRITSLPPESMQLAEAYTVAMSQNPLVSLPESGVDPRAVYATWILLDSTQLSALPEWMDDAFLLEKIIPMGETPLCRDVLLNASAAEQATALVAQRSALNATTRCDVYYPEREGFYPLHVEVRPHEAW